MIVGDTEILGGAAQVLLVLPIGGFLSSPSIVLWLFLIPE